MNEKTQKIKVLSFSGAKLDTPRGTPLRVLKLVKGLSQRQDIDLTICSTDEVSPVNGVRHLKMARADSYKDYLTVLNFVRKEKVDVVVGHTLKSIRLLFLIKLFSKAKFFLEVHGFIAEEALEAKKIGKLRYFINTQFHKLAFFGADLVTTFSPTATNFAKKYNRNSSTLFSGADTKLFNPEVKPKYSFKKNDETIVIGYAGNSAKYQGLDFLRSSFDKLLLENGNLHLALLLSDCNKDVYSEHVSIISRLPQNEVPKFLASCDVLVVPRPDNRITRISFASKILDYMAMGKPVIVSRVGDPESVITDGINGFLYEPENFQDFLDKIRVIYKSQKRESTGISARNTVDSLYSNDLINDMFYSLISTLKR